MRYGRTIFSTKLSSFHPDGYRRGLRLPEGSEVITVEIVALAPLRANEFRLVLLIPLLA